MKICQRGIALIKSFEGLRLTAYKCPAGIWTVGFGHTGPDVLPYMVITEQQAEGLLRKDLEVFEETVESSVTTQLTQNQFDACVCLAFNIGRGAFRSSTLVKFLNNEQYEDAAEQFLRWNRGGGRVLPGLTRRREAERKLFLEE